MDIQILRSRRKTLSMELKDGGVLVRAPRWVSREEIDRFVASHQAWLQKALTREARRQAELAAVVPLTPEELDDLAAQARAYLPQRVAFYAPLVGVDYGKITIRRQRARWGSCSAQGNLSFNCLLMLAPPAVLDSVVVHELCHRKVMNHSPRFYQLLLRVMPDYQTHHRWLKQNGPALIARLPRRT